MSGTVIVEGRGKVFADPDTVVIEGEVYVPLQAFVQNVGMSVVIDGGSYAVSRTGAAPTPAATPEEEFYFFATPTPSATPVATPTIAPTMTPAPTAVLSDFIPVTEEAAVTLDIFPEVIDELLRDGFSPWEVEEYLYA